VKEYWKQYFSRGEPYYDVAGCTQYNIFYLVDVLIARRNLFFREQIREAEEIIKARTANPANFGFTFQRQCICEVPGQVPCPGWKPLPKEMTGKWRMKKLQESSS